MLHLKKVLGAKPKEHVEAELGELMTPWGETLDADHVLEEHPDPQFARGSFVTLNGWWDYAFAPGGFNADDDLEAVVREARQPEAWDGRILVPFSPEASLSSVGRRLCPDEFLWYRRFVELHGGEGSLKLRDGERAILHFQAVDAACAVWCNGQLVGTHAGAYDPFAFDITDALATDADGKACAELSVCVADPSEFGGQPRGKQRFDRGDIWYSAQSGIWQSVWLETVPQDHLVSLDIQSDAETGILAVGVRLSTQASHELRMEVYDADGRIVGCDACEAGASGEVAAALALHVADVRLWSPDDPFLYQLRITYGDDAVASYCAFRTVELARDDEGHLRVSLNGEPLFLRGVLDQGYWPDGLMTAPADEALVHDIQAMRRLGFNMMRKHAKVESARWYYHCDRLGMLVWQDMVNGGDGDIKTWHWSYKPTLFKLSWSHYGDTSRRHQDKLGSGSRAYRDEWERACRCVVRSLGNHPCILAWSLFNEGWGQFDARRMCAMVRELDPTRPVDAVSGWYDQRCGDFLSVHNYFRDMAVWRDPGRWRDGGSRAFLMSECGGFSHLVEGHSSLDESYGYEVYDDIDEWRRAVRALLDKLDALKVCGMAGFVYTQVSDIEEETNGLLTYDRCISKLEEGGGADAVNDSL